MRTNLKIFYVVLLLSTNLHSDDSRDKHQQENESLFKAPLQSELNKAYKGGEKIGKKAGKGTKNFFCSELKWSFFCKGEKK